MAIRDPRGKKKTGGNKPPAGGSPAPVDLPAIADEPEDSIHTEITSVDDLEIWLDGHRFRAVDDEAEDDDESTAVMGRTLVRDLISAERRRELQEQATVSGLLQEFGVGELLQMFAQRRRVGQLVVKGKRGTGRIWMEQGNLVSALWEHEPELSPMDAVRELARIETGEFWFGPAPDEPSGDRVNKPLLHVLLALAPAEGAGEAATIDERTDEHPTETSHESVDSDPTLPLPADSALLRVPDPLEPPLTSLTDVELEVLQEVMNRRSMAAVLRSAGSGDRERVVRETVGELIARRYLYISDE